MTLIYFSDPGHKEAQIRWVQGRLISAYKNSGMGISSFGAESDKAYKDKLKKNCLRFILLAMVAIILKLVSDKVNSMFFEVVFRTL